uniref:Uncharacterized protein n=1 Tax=Lates calcarifer TaxID=8187 RepID=A0A4W6BR35_LATCA
MSHGDLWLSAPATRLVGVPSPDLLEPILGDEEADLGEEADLDDEGVDLLGEEADLCGEDADLGGEETDLLGEEGDLCGEDTDLFGKEADLCVEDADLGELGVFSTQGAESIVKLLFEEFLGILEACL